MVSLRNSGSNTPAGHEGLVPKLSCASVSLRSFPGALGGGFEKWHHTGIQGIQEFCLAQRFGAS